MRVIGKLFLSILIPAIGIILLLVALYGAISFIDNYLHRVHACFDSSAKSCVTIFRKNAHDVYLIPGKNKDIFTSRPSVNYIKANFLTDFKSDSQSFDLVWSKKGLIQIYIDKSISKEVDLTSDGVKYVNSSLKKDLIADESVLSIPFSETVYFPLVNEIYTKKYLKE